MPLNILNWASNSLCSASSLAHVLAAAFAASPAG